MKLVTWDDGKTKSEMVKRWKNSSDSRIYFEDRWIRNERVIYATSSTLNMSYLQTSLESNFNIGLPGIDGSNADVNCAYTFKNFRFIHAQMSANPPSVVMRPNTSDQEDHRKADAADRVVRWSIRHYNLQEKVDQLSLHTLLYGSGMAKTVWDSTLGEIVDFDEQKDEITLAGDISITVPFMWNVFLDPDAKCWDEVNYIIERVYIDYDEALARWPDKLDELKNARVERQNVAGRERSTQLQNTRYNSVELLEYWEKGLPTNGYLGRYCITTTDGSVIESCRPNPFRFRQAGAVSKIENSDLPDEVKRAKTKKLQQYARLPYHLLTDIDVPNSVWGRSFIEYTANLQENLNRLDSATLDNIQAHGATRVVVPETADVDDNLTNSPWDILKISGNQGPYFMAPPQMMPDMASTRTNYINAINDVSGVNESMFGQQSREQAAAAMQYATNQGNMVRRRLFNKYVAVVESFYKAILDLVRKHWTIEHTIQVLGKENALESIDLKGADIDGGYNVIGEYGVSLSLDPMTRREEILQLQPMFKEAGVPMRTTLRMLKLNELEGMYDAISLAENRQKEVFDEIAATGNYIAPEEQMDHENMIGYALNWFMTSEFKYIDPQIQDLCKQHNKARIQLAAQEKAGQAGPATGVQPGGGNPPPGPATAAGPAGAVPPPGGLPSPLPGGGAPVPPPAAPPPGPTVPGGAPAGP